MLYNLLTDYKGYLGEFYRPNTVRIYYDRLCVLLATQNATAPLRLDIDKVLEALATIKHKNTFSQSKNAFYHFCQFQHITLSETTKRKIKELEKKRHRRYRKSRVIHYKDILNAVHHIKNIKLRLSYQVMIATGLRVFELAQIKVNDCTITTEKMIFQFVGKGGNLETVTINKKDFPKLYKNLTTLIHTTQPHKKVFYSAIYLQKKSKQLGFQCHDLRRIFARLEYNRTKSKEEVKKKMRHTQLKNTTIYLRSHIDYK